MGFGGCIREMRASGEKARGKKSKKISLSLLGSQRRGGEWRDPKKRVVRGKTNGKEIKTEKQCIVKAEVERR